MASGSLSLSGPTPNVERNAGGSQLSTVWRSEAPAPLRKGESCRRLYSSEDWFTNYSWMSPAFSALVLSILVGVLSAVFPFILRLPKSLRKEEEFERRKSRRIYPRRRIPHSFVFPGWAWVWATTQMLSLVMALQEQRFSLEGEGHAPVPVGIGYEGFFSQVKTSRSQERTYDEMSSCFCSSPELCHAQMP